MKITKRIETTTAQLVRHLVENRGIVLFILVVLCYYCCCFCYSLIVVFARYSSPALLHMMLDFALSERLIETLAQ